MLTELSAFSCIVPAIIGTVKYKRVDNKFHPFIWIIYLSVTTETIVFIVKQLKQFRPVYFIVGNCYYIINIVLLLEFFKRLLIIKRTTAIVLTAICLLTLTILSCFFLPTKNLLLNATVVYDAILLALTVNLLSKQVLVFNMPFYKNVLFIISSMLLFYTAFSFFLNVIYLLQLESQFNNFLFGIHKYVNLVTYLVFAWAIICIPSKST